ncbi:MAG: hypothetical protein RJA22_2154 [Verrucomicrobiota bacterium]|jgi:CheY-like chemotaxis protein
MTGTPQKVLLLDDDQDFLDLYREMLSRHLPSLPEVHTANSGARALSMLESEAFNLLVTDLNMPKMDGLQVLSVAGRKFPHLRLVVLTSLRDEQFRARAYALGVDQYWVKPESDHEMGLFMESIESLLSREAQAGGGFRGVQSKSLVDIVQLECLGQSSVVLKITNGLAEGRIWIQSGEVIDAEALELGGEAAFQRILTWKAGSFELLPPDPARARKIFTSYQGLLLNTAQTLDENASRLAEAEQAAAAGAAAGEPAPSTSAALLEALSRMNHVEFVLACGAERGREDFWGLENPKPVVEFTRETLANFRALGERLQVGQLQQVLGTGPDRKLALASCGQTDVCVGVSPALPAETLRDTLRNLLTQWAS